MKLDSRDIHTVSEYKNVITFRLILSRYALIQKTLRHASHAKVEVLKCELSIHDQCSYAENTLTWSVDSFTYIFHHSVELLRLISIHVVRSPIYQQDSGVGLSPDLGHAVP